MRANNRRWGEGYSEAGIFKYISLMCAHTASSFMSCGRCVSVVNTVS